MRSGASKSVKKQRIGLIFLCVFLALILALLVFLSFAADKMFGLLGRDSTRETISLESLQAIMAAGETRPADFNEADLHITMPTEAADVIASQEGILNFLLVGTDKGKANRSDAMMIFSVDMKNHDITLISFLRDSYVTIPNYFSHKLNTSYFLGQTPLLRQTLEYNFGITVDGSVALDFNAFRSAVNLIGGVEVEMTASEAQYMNSVSNAHYEEGVNLMMGYDSMVFARIRKLDGQGDMARTDRQRRLISAIIKRVCSMSMLEIADVISQVLPTVKTDMTDAEIMTYVVKLLPVLLDCSMEAQQIPAEGTYHLSWVEQDGGMSIIRIDSFDQNRQILQDILTRSAASAEADTTAAAAG